MAKEITKEDVLKLFPGLYDYQVDIVIKLMSLPREDRQRILEGLK